MSPHLLHKEETICYPRSAWVGLGVRKQQQAPQGLVQGLALEGVFINAHAHT